MVKKGKSHYSMW
jgi:hypothetical protein